MKRLGFHECFTDVTSGNKKFRTTEYLQEGLIPIIDQGKKFIGGYTDSGKDKFKGNLPCIVYGDHSREVKYIDFDFALGADGVKALEVNSKLLNPKFAYYYLITVKLPEAGYDRSFKFLKRIDVPVPDLQTQRQIVAALDKAQSIIDKRQKSIELLDELLRATFLDMFGNPIANPKNWPLQEIGEISVSRLGKMLDSKQTTKDYLKPYLGNKNVRWFQFDLQNLKEMDFDESEQKKFELRDGDVLMCEGGEVGRCAIWRNQISDCYYQKALHRIRFNHDVILPEYFVMMFYLFINGNGLRRFIGTSTIAHLTGVKLKKIKVPIPDIQLQIDFKKIEKEISLLKEKKERSQSNLRLLFQSLLQRAFHGDLSLDMDLQLDAFINSEDLQAIDEDNALIQLLIDRFESRNLGKEETENSNGESESGYQFESLATYEKAKHVLFHLLKEEKVVQQYDAENNKTSLSLP